MANTPQIPQSEHPIIQIKARNTALIEDNRFRLNEDKKIDRIWYNFLEQIVAKLTQLDGGTP